MIIRVLIKLVLFFNVFSYFLNRCSIHGSILLPNCGELRLILRIYGLQISRLVCYRTIISKFIILQTLCLLLINFDPKHDHNLLDLDHLLLSDLQVIHPFENKDVSKNPLIFDEIHDTHNNLLSQIL